MDQKGGVWNWVEELDYTVEVESAPDAVNDVEDVSVG